MQLPRLRIPSFWPDWAMGLLSRSVLLYGIYTFVLFLVFLVVTFPDNALNDLVVPRVLELSKNPMVNVDISDARLAWLNGSVEFEGVRLAPLPVREGVPPFLEWTRLRVRPDLAALVKGDFTSYVISGELYGGTASGFVNAANGNVVAHLQWSGLDLRRYRAITASMDEGNVTGTLSGTWDVEYAMGQKSAEGTGELTLSGGSIQGAKIKGFKIPDLTVNEANAKFTLQGNRLEIKELTATGEELNLQATGNVVIKEPPPSSDLNLSIRLQKLPPNLKPLLAFLPRRGGVRENTTITITGTAEHPTIR